MRFKNRMSVVKFYSDKNRMKSDGNGRNGLESHNSFLCYRKHGVYS